MPVLTSPRGTIVEGHSTTQQDLDDIARTVLERSSVERDAVPDLRIAEEDGTAIAVRMELGRGKQLSLRALPASGFVLRPLTEMQAEADRDHRNVHYIELSRIYSNGSCAVLHVGADFVLPSKTHSMKMCCCSAQDIYEKRAGSWVFVRRVSHVCS